MYEKELKALQRAGRFRKRQIFPLDVKDFASNDYLGLAHDKELLKRAYEKVSQFPYNTSKASALINGYTPIHQAFEKALCQLNGFESCITVGSGFLANLALIESLVRKKDRLFIDEEFHASGILASRLVDQVEFFAHNDAKDLQKRLQKGGYNRAVVAVEGIYSMSGDILDPEIFEVAKESLLIVDEAHSSGVIGKNLLGVFDHYGIEPTPMHIKMGTLGKAYASYGAYILANSEVVSYLENRAKSIIYTTALSLMDVALAHEALEKIVQQKEFFYRAIQTRQSIAKEFGYETPGLIVDIPKKDVLHIQKELLDRGYLVGAIRPPTVPKSMIRVIARLGESEEDFVKVLEMLS
ncbi:MULTISPECIES: pyridoxal phosphate-dependent aminotransferase family protein [unclassified Nitratiruptor]|uniref:aminotransferase class I/II-fold pyridoxal phosphate-dependent enzyme n=1 Tax=unclassified Nitratiruptor TaxID=2624044 RepID=UPI001914E777|nr:MULTISPECIES: pyridoxal phosphate-dependent aminotransferase family protein [unclassified Nitratiruptor]BCD60826.1 8-amino-7-oxononanoate synthase [Nitratiruptor sp. YY08-10]BCD64758.1 8-amino-7-oxononanoate synthase [Nitratiruptor sp. YY08-14]